MPGPDGVRSDAPVDVAPTRRSLREAERRAAAEAELRAAARVPAAAPVRPASVRPSQAGPVGPAGARRTVGMPPTTAWSPGPSGFVPRPAEPVHSGPTPTVAVGVVEPAVAAEQVSTPHSGVPSWTPRPSAVREPAVAPEDAREGAPAHAWHHGEPEADERATRSVTSSLDARAAMPVQHAVREPGAPQVSQRPAPAPEQPAPATQSAPATATVPLVVVAPADSSAEAAPAARSSALPSPQGGSTAHATVVRAHRAGTRRTAAVGMPRHHRPARAATRVGVLGTLAALTVVIPVSQGAIAGAEVISGEPVAKVALPSTVTALTSTQSSLVPPASLQTTAGVLSDRDIEAATRSLDRTSALPGCDPAARAPGQNGMLAQKDLCTLWDGHTRLRADAASSLAQFNQAYVAAFGADMCLASGYRTLAEQRYLKSEKGGLAAAPGKSNHGWGLAVDLCSPLTSGVKWAWINANAPRFGWENPSWAKPGGSGPYERWHWEYSKGVKADGEYYG
ncbi:D-alanyl-D-alanine carboxypeptidase family protein [Cellulomonas sp. HZM]|uniref:D-alanyl-D-alanine carboxypeptidase family protein n=1 Tax=Cellulomonas sp. HZM TaxID=1454010 RepID=UPI0018CC38E1|nr:D-alanyl-D-alanine carboxypeptidase family protein [Cellulomonas sp. HZM]